VPVGGRSLRDRARRRLRPVKHSLIDVSAKLRAKARNPRVKTRIAPGEDMLTGGPNLRNYFEVAESAMTQIKAGIEDAGMLPPKRILDLPCGYGRVLRYLRAEWPEAALTAMDINAEAVQFCAASFAARPVISRDPLWEVDAGDGYDLLWCGSLLTHFDEPDWLPILSYFRDRMTSGGLIVFTTHGDLSIDALAGEPAMVASLGLPLGDYGMGPKAADMAGAARRTGFAYGHYGDTDGPFGLSVSAPEWVRATAGAVSGLDFVRFAPAGWFDHQDVWAYQVRRSAG
jgi:SAM-dependent methyltransferase